MRLYPPGAGNHQKAQALLRNRASCRVRTLWQVISLATPPAPAARRRVGEGG
jgi:hypothetical protein